MTHGEHYLAGTGALLVVVLWSSCCSGGCPHVWLLFSVYLIVLSQGTSLNVSAERRPIKAGVSLFCISAHLTNIFTILKHCFPWISTPVCNSCSADPSKAASAEGLGSVCTVSLPGSAGLCRNPL